MKTYRIIWKRKDFVLDNMEFYHVIIPASNKVMALAAVRKYFMSVIDLRYAFSVISLEVEIGKGNRSSSYWRVLDCRNIYLADYRIQSVALDIEPLVVRGLPNDCVTSDENPSEMRQAFNVQEWMIRNPRSGARYNDILLSFDDTGIS